MTTPAPTPLQQARKNLLTVIKQLEQRAHNSIDTERANERVEKFIDELIIEAQLAVHRTKD